MMFLFYFLAALILARLIFALWPKAVTKRRPALSGLGWKIIYENGKILKAPAHCLQGRPDIIYAKGQNFLPVELKSGKTGGAGHPHEGDLMQLAVYFFLIEAEYGKRPREGRLVYADAMFVVKNTRAIRDAVLRKVSAMEEMLANPPSPAEAEQDFNKCRRCPARDTVCL